MEPDSVTGLLPPDPKVDPGVEEVGVPEGGVGNIPSEIFDLIGVRPASEPDRALPATSVGVGGRGILGGGILGGGRFRILPDVFGLRTPKVADERTVPADPAEMADEEPERIDADEAEATDLSEG